MLQIGFEDYAVTQKESVVVWRDLSTLNVIGAVVSCGYGHTINPKPYVAWFHSWRYGGQNMEFLFFRASTGPKPTRSNVDIPYSRHFLSLLSS